MKQLREVKHSGKYSEGQISSNNEFAMNQQGRNYPMWLCVTMSRVERQFGYARIVACYLLMLCWDHESPCLHPTDHWQLSTYECYCFGYSVSCQLIRSKSNLTFSLVKIPYTIEHTVALIQPVDNVEQYDDVKFPQSKRMM